MSLPPNTRRSTRLPLVRDLQAHFDTVESAIVTRTLDVGRHGFLISSPTIFPVGTRVRFLLTFEEPEVRLELSGVVVRIEPATGVQAGRMGVELTEHSSEWDHVYDLLAAARLAKST
jgi:hypothetical protein